MSEGPVEGLQPIADACRNLDVGAPPPAVDAAVKAHARAAARRRRSIAWTVPAALAATVLIAFSIVLQVKRDEATPDAVANRQEAAATLEETAPAPPPPASAPATDIAAEEAAAPTPAPAASGKAVAPMRAPAATEHPAVASGARAESPEDWLARIEALEAADRHEEAEAERRRLDETYPGWLEQQAAGRD